jgi:hypothetical protein
MAREFSEGEYQACSGIWPGYVYKSIAAGAKARVLFSVHAARLKSCPKKEIEFRFFCKRNDLRANGSKAS